MTRDVMSRGQTYRWLGEFPHVRANGAATALDHWATECADCGAACRLKTAIPLDISRISRRCQACKKPGVKYTRHDPRARP